MKRMKASEFKASCLKVMEEVAEYGEPVVITKRGKPISRLEPEGQRPATLFGVTRGAIEVIGDLIEPIDVEWEADR